MPARYMSEALNRIQESLDATGVLSKEYKGFIMSWALAAYADGCEAGKESVKPADVLTEDVFAPIPDDVREAAQEAVKKLLPIHNGEVHVSDIANDVEQALNHVRKIANYKQTQ